MINYSKKYLLLAIIIISCFFLVNQAWADFEIAADKLAKRFIFNSTDGQMSLKVFPNSFSKSVTFEILEHNNTDYVAPTGYSFDSQVYEYSVSNPKAFKPKKYFQITLNYDFDYIDQNADHTLPTTVADYHAGFIATQIVTDYTRIDTDYTQIITDYSQISFEKDTNFDRAIWILDLEKNTWQRIKSYNYFDSQTVVGNLKKTSAIIAILKSNQLMTEGRASWYKYKGCDCAASPDYPKGTKLKVTNTANGKSVVVTINDWGPERDLFPNRVIDLDVTAFKKIANKRLGTCAVKVELFTEPTNQ